VSQNEEDDQRFQWNSATVLRRVCSFLFQKNEIPRSITSRGISNIHCGNRDCCWNRSAMV
jgi:hypothetical protein